MNVEESVERVPCPKCGAPTDPLRAARVRLIANRFFYFCSTRCAEQFTEEDFRSSPPPAASVAKHRQSDTAQDNPARDTAVARGVEVPLSAPEPTATEPVLERRSKQSLKPKPAVLEPAVAENLAETSSAEAAATVEPSAGEPVLHVLEAAAERRLRLPWKLKDRVLLNLAIAAALLSVVLILARESVLTLWARALLASLGSVLLLVHSLRPTQESPSHHPLEVSAMPLLAALFSVLLIVLRLEAAALATLYAGLGLLAASLSWSLVVRIGAPVDRQRRELQRQLNQEPEPVRRESPAQAPLDGLKPGEEIVIHAGEMIRVDASVVSGRAEVRPWLDAEVVSAVEPGDSLYAGARLVSGQVRATVRWTGLDRQWERLVNDPERRVDLHAPMVLLVRKLARRGALVAGVLGLGAGVLQGLDASLVGVLVLALVGAFLHPAYWRLPGFRMLQTVLEGQRAGIVFRSAAVVDTAGGISTAVFCIRGTLLLGEPELASIESFSDLDGDAILALAAGAEQHARHPIAAAISRAARARGIRADAVRTPQAWPGLGVSALAANGQRLVVGSRALMLKECISVARAERRIAELEGKARTILLVALAQRLVGLLALQDGLRAGARAAVQHLLDAGVEPVLLSGDARETCEALGRTLDVEHIRPEILPADRGAEIERLKQGSATVAVIGRSPADDMALSTATVAIALAGRGSRTGDFDVELGSNEVQKAALALRLAHRCRSQLVRGATALVIGITLSCLLVVALSVSAAVIPLISLGGILLASALMFASPRSSNR